MSYPEALLRHLNKTTATYVWGVVNDLNVVMRVVRPRKTKLGDCKYDWRYKTGLIVITVNGDLESFQFLITMVHELAHAKTFRENSSRVKPHGEEWKANFRTLFQPIIDGQFLSNKENDILNKILVNPKASTCDATLIDFLKEENGEQVTLLKDLKIGDCFLVNNEKYVVNEKLRTRYTCTRLQNNRKYRVHGLAKVEFLYSTNEEEITESLEVNLLQNTKEQHVVMLSDLKVGDCFVLNNEKYIVNQKNQKNYICTKISNKTKYKIRGQARIVSLPNEDGEKILIDLQNDALLKAKEQDSILRIKDLEAEDQFIFKGMIYIRGKKLRTRYECFEVKTQETYLISGEAPIKLNFRIQTTLDFLNSI